MSTPRADEALNAFRDLARDGLEGSTLMYHYTRMIELLNCLVNDELILELAVSANCEYIVTHNVRDFKGSEEFGIQAITPKEFLQIIREV